MIKSKTSDFYGYPDTVSTRSIIKSQDFQKSCGTGLVGTLVNYSKTYTITGTQADLDTLVLADASNFTAEGQTKANNEGTCVNTCAKVYISIHPSAVVMTHMTNNVRYFAYGYQGLNSPYTATQGLNRESYHEAFRNNVGNYLKMTEPVQFMTPNILVGRKIIGGPTSQISELWIHYNNGGLDNCGLGYKLCNLPDGVWDFIDLGAPSTVGWVLGAISICIKNSRTLSVIHTDYDTNLHTLIGEINTKTSDYSTNNGKIKTKMTFDSQGGLYIAIASYKRSGSDGNIGVWYTNYVNRGFNPVSFVNLYPWNYSNQEPSLINIRGRSNGSGAIMVYTQKGSGSNQNVASMGLNTGGIGTKNIAVIPKSDVISVVNNADDHRIYLFNSSNGTAYKAFNFSNNTWSSI